ncbi:hypothetical protein [Novosphingobium sp. ST904]|uniref:hypothetical protein n=2 Tax=Novosphingobium sp. ST904 TaxID=1684385 RepID=UPI000AED28B7|nr:hypothetical protein [Novosphingobium sp. ST904]TCM40113.1 hypothetical protein EDF59_105353 [Novosphingobium sp. ST904]
MYDTPDPASMKAVIDRLERGDRKFDEMAEFNHATDAKVEALAAAIAKISEAVQPIQDIKTDVEKMKGDVEKTKDIVEAWSAVKTLGKFLKWVAGLIAAASVVLVAMKAVGLHIFRG